MLTKQNCIGNEAAVLMMLWNVPIMQLAKYDTKSFLELYKSLPQYILRLYGNPLHQSIINMAWSLTKEMSGECAIKAALKHFKHVFGFDKLIAEAACIEDEEF